MPLLKENKHDGQKVAENGCDLSINPTEEESAKILERVLQESGVSFRKTAPGEEGGFFVTDKSGKRKRLVITFKDIFGVGPGGT